MKSVLFVIAILCGIWAGAQIPDSLIGKMWAHPVLKHGGNEYKIIRSNGKSYITYAGDTMQVENNFYVDTVYTEVPLYYTRKNGKTIFSMRKTKGSKLYTKPTTFYGEVGIKTQPIDSSKYFYRRFMAERKKGVPDSLNKFKSKLYKK